MNTSKPATQKQPTTPATLPETGYIRISQLVKIIPFSASTIWRKSRNGSFPKPYKLSEQVSAWKNLEILEWMDSTEAKAVNNG